MRFDDFPQNGKRTLTREILQRLDRFNLHRFIATPRDARRHVTY